MGTKTPEIARLESGGVGNTILSATRFKQCDSCYPRHAACLSDIHVRTT
jgi:hypothetical protein